MKGVGAEHQETLSVPLHRGMTCGPYVSTPKQGDLGGLHGPCRATPFKKRKRLQSLE